MRTPVKLLAVGVAAAVLAVSPLSATILKQMNLADLAGNAHGIFSGTVIEASKGTLAVGGGTIATVSYRVIVDNAFRGEFVEKDGLRIADITMITEPAQRRVGNQVSFSILPKMPDIQVGQRYLFFTTAPSAIGLSTTVGLGQGCFRINGEGGEAILSNEFDNLGLFRGMGVTGMPERGPIGYSNLVQQIEALLGSK